jgi:hypothetical protein
MSKTVLVRIFEETYPKLFDLMFSIAHDCGATNREENIQFELPSNYPLKEFDDQLNLLNNEDFELFAIGEDTEREEFIEQHPELKPIDEMIENHWIGHF